MNQERMLALQSKKNESSREKMEAFDEKSRAKLTCPSKLAFAFARLLAIAMAFITSGATNRLLALQAIEAFGADYNRRGFKRRLGFFRSGQLAEKPPAIPETNA